MRLVGDPEGITQLKAMHAHNKEAIKFLVGEAKSNTDLTALFVGGDGVRYWLKVDIKTGDLHVERKEPQ
jgi:hypothetical protein